jgi:tetratricopeptide (TPR) repeat protein
MNKEDIIAQKKQILAHLSKRQLKKAFNLLISMSSSLQEWQIIERLNELETNYRFMLHYLFEGVEDTERNNVYNNLLRSLYELTDDVTDELLKYTSSNVYHEKIRIEELRTPISINEYHEQLKNISESASLLSLAEDNEEKTSRSLNLAVQRERIASDMFTSVFISKRADENNMNDYISFLDSIDLSVREKCLFISALSLSLFHRFDSRKLQVLMHASASDDIQIKARAVVGLIIILQMYDVRWELYPELQNRIDVLGENPDFKKLVLQVIIQLIRSRETELISKKISEEIIPEMMRFNSMAGRKLNMEDLMNENEFSEKNPEWQKELEESGLAGKLQEYSNLQMEGSDVFHSTFAGLKNFPFFREMSNWFMPFDTSYSELRGLFPDQKENLLKTAIVDSTHMCDSDKYSFCLSLLQISSAQREQMMHQLGAESEQIKELQKEAKSMNSSIDEEIISNQYIQNLYRFFKLNPYRSNFFDIFNLRLNFYDKKSITPLISDTESMKKIASFCFSKNFFREALDSFNKLIAIEETGDIWQKIGYCHQMLENLQAALDAYLQADLLTPNNSWILKRIAHIYRSLKQPEHALDYYKKAAKLTTDNVGLELNIGHCFLELKEYDEALNRYFKVELLDDKHQKALRPIAWTAFLLHKFDLSKKYYERILNNKPTIHDYLNAGHVELCMNNKSMAIDLYIKVIEQYSNFDQFTELFDADKEALINTGIDPQIFPFILDEIQYRVSKNKE